MNRTAKSVISIVLAAALVCFALVPTASAIIDPISLSVIGLGAMIIGTSVAESQQPEAAEDRVAAVPEPVQALPAGDAGAVQAN